MSIRLTSFVVRRDLATSQIDGTHFWIADPRSSRMRQRINVRIKAETPPEMAKVLAAILSGEDK